MCVMKDKSGVNNGCPRKKEEEEKKKKKGAEVSIR